MYRWPWLQDWPQFEKPRKSIILASRIVRRKPIDNMHKKCRCSVPQFKEENIAVKVDLPC